MNQKMTMNIIGKIFIILLTNFACLLSQAHLAILDLNGVAIKQAGVGVPFVLKVDIERGANDNTKPEIEGLKNKNITSKYEGTSSTITNIAGQVTVERSFKYILRIDTEGTYQLGPAKLYVQGDVLESNVVSVKVGPEQITKRKQNSNTAELKIEVDKLNPFQGEKVNFKLVLKGYGQPNIVGISDPELKNFNIEKVEGPFENSFYEKDQKVFTLVWDYTIYPNKTGKIIIPSVSVVLKIPDQNDNSIFSAFFNSFKKETVSSNSLILDVRKLPKGNFDAVGTFTNFEIKLDKHKLEQGNAALLKFVLTGEANLSNIDLDIKNVPQELKVYKSNSEIYGNAKTFEFVVQGIKPGEYIIPAQSFGYFDPHSEIFNTLKTKNKKIKITESKLDSYKNQISDTKKAGLDTAIDADASLILENNLVYHEPIKLPNILFFICLIFPGLISLGLFFYSKFKNSKNYKLFVLKKRLDFGDIHLVFIEIASIKLNKNMSQVSIQDLQNLIDDKNWQSFVNKIIAMNYDGALQNKKRDEQLIQEAKYWVSVIEKS
ncbi:hypothetical protein A3F66_02175 [candidate division TM6 bacterium RIFCSPHIGHO2_12_FULL_32_22]|nr:MAG: hypothetical protein A3F66_02175 [candidate division TM6 bacterium RIFCSPHIGHO2_12_FULL_32_22]